MDVDWLPDINLKMVKFVATSQQINVLLIEIKILKVMIKEENLIEKNQIFVIMVAET
jgi:hypothetical protein